MSNRTHSPKRDLHAEITANLINAIEAPQGAVARSSILDSYYSLGASVVVGMMLCCICARM